MTRIMAQYVPLEMALLGLLELALSFLFIYGMLTAPGVLTLLATASPYLTENCTYLAVALTFTIAATAATIGLYRPEVCLDRRRLLTNATVTGLVAFPAIVLVSGGPRLSLSAQDVFWLAKMLSLWLVGLLFIRLLYGLVFSRGQAARRVLILGDSPNGTRLIRHLGGKGPGLYEALSNRDNTMPLTVEALRSQNIWGVVVAGGGGEIPLDQLRDSKLRGIRVFNEASFYETHLGRINLDTLNAQWFINAEGFSNGALLAAIKRLFDIAASATLLLLTLPLMLLVALMIRSDSPGPVLYRQVRTGLFGKPFTLLKFRSMRLDAEAGGTAIWAQKRDPRITRTGNFIRSTRIDELPQLLNVLRGEMSMIGPRPERPVFVEELAKVIPFYHERAYVKPGITGWAQVNFPYGASVEDAREKLAYDLYYVKNHGLLLDLLIFVSTIRVILFREGAR